MILGTWLFTKMRGELVGTDGEGNRYYQDKRVVDGRRRKRWVIYNGYTEATMIPPAWHGWIHHTVDTPPVDERYVAHAWEKPHRPNPTGTPAAQRPIGSTLAQGRRPKATGDYKAWVPGTGN